MKVIKRMVAMLLAVAMMVPVSINGVVAFAETKVAVEKIPMVGCNIDEEEKNYNEIIEMLYN